jgi:23S rRNA (uracil1939-C5)-methyltransferase
MSENIFTVEKVVHGGKGIVRDGRSAIFVPFVLAGEKIKIKILPSKKGAVQAELLEVVEASPKRSVSSCPLFGKCGGCQLQHIEYAQQTKIKTDILKETIGRIAKLDIEVGQTAAAKFPYNYRSRIKLHVKKGKAGFFSAINKDILKIEYCHIADAKLNEALGPLSSLLKAKRPRSADLVIAENGLISTVLVNGKKRRTYEHVSMGQGKSWIKTAAGKIPFQQVNPHQNEILKDVVSKLVKNISPKSVIELYAGSGNLTRRIAEYCGDITAVERDIAAVELWEQNFSDTPNVKFIKGESKEFLTKAHKNNIKPDLVLLDPPRTGAKYSAPLIVEIRPQNIVYVSCDPGTLARDIKTLTEAGYKVCSVQPIDMFPQTSHIESVTLLSTTG